jgi:septal ring-binding cell division protein DamX
LERFIASHELHESTTIVRSAREGRDWYLALSGQYRSAGAAMAAVEALPPALRESGAWVRSFRSVRETLPQP